MCFKEDEKSSSASIEHILFVLNVIPHSPCNIHTRLQSLHFCNLYHQDTCSQLAFWPKAPHHTSPHQHHTMHQDLSDQLQEVPQERCSDSNTRMKFLNRGSSLGSKESTPKSQGSHSNGILDQSKAWVKKCKPNHLGTQLMSDIVLGHRSTDQRLDDVETGGSSMGLSNENQPSFRSDSLTKYTDSSDYLGVGVHLSSDTGDQIHTPSGSTQTHSGTQPTNLPFISPSIMTASSSHSSSAMLIREDSSGMQISYVGDINLQQPRPIYPIPLIQTHQQTDDMLQKALQSFEDAAEVRMISKMEEGSAVMSITD